MHVACRYSVEAWLKAGTAVHSVKDNPAHGIPMMGGMWGGVKQMLKYSTT